MVFQPPAGIQIAFQATQWTENHGGMDFLIAVDPQGSLQYLTDVRTHHFANGPKITNASYSGVTADGYIHAQRKVSTWTVDDFPRLLLGGTNRASLFPLTVAALPRGRATEALMKLRSAKERAR